MFYDMGMNLHLSSESDPGIDTKIDSPTDSLLQRFKETLLNLNNRPTRVTPQLDETSERTRAAVRLLARSRVSETLRQLRAAHGLSYEQVQDQTRLSKQLLYDVEYRDRRVTLEELRQLAQCYGVSVGDVLGIDLV